MKYVYVLVSNDTDYYLENALLSITSLRMYTPRAFVVLLMDDRTEKTLTGTRRTILDLVDETAVPVMKDTLTKKERSRWLKTGARAHIAGDFLYIDCDTVIAGDLSDIDSLDMELGAVMDSHTTWYDDMPIACRQFRAKFLKWDKALGFESIAKTNKHFNSGVMLCRDTPDVHRFFDKWHELWLYSHNICPMDQIPLNQADYLFGGCIKELDGVWNCQVYATGMMRYLSNAKVIHFWGGGMSKFESVYRLASPALFAEIKATGCVSAEAQALLQSPKTAFAERTHLFKEDPFLFSPTGIFLKGLYRRHLIGRLDVPLGRLLRLHDALRKRWGAGGG